MKTNFIIGCLFVFVTSCASTSRLPAKNESMDNLACTSKTLQSSDIDLFWQLEVDDSLENILEDICIVPVLALHPTQFAVGMIDVQRKAEKIQSMSEKKQDKYLRNNPEPIVVGPNGEFYIIDHHHLATALDKSGIQSTYGIILENKNGMKQEDFWKFMKEKNWVYLIDQNGLKRSITELEGIASVRQLKDDPYRTLAGQTRCKVEAKCAEDQWLKKAVPFIEFLWAEHFRKTPSIVAALKKFGSSDFSQVTSTAALEVKRLKGQLPAN